MTQPSLVGGVGSGKTAPCEHCGKPVEQPYNFPRTVKQWCGPRCQRAAESASDWDKTDELLADLNSRSRP